MVRTRVTALRVIVILVCLCFAAGIAYAGDQKDKPKASPATTTEASQGPSSSATYMGSDVCKTCHEDIYNNLAKTPHFQTTLDTHVAHARGCEGCHGPGSEHVAGGGDITKIFVFKNATPKEVTARCMTCHQSTTEQMHFNTSVHAQNNVSCIDCHSPHHAVTKEALLVKPQTELCYSCHLQQKAQFQMPFHHRVNEGLVQCTDCHNPHGTIRAMQVRSSSTGDVACFKCHADKQGPFVFEHEPVKGEGCQSCHTPHGGPNPHMLKVSNVNLLCLQCHTTSTFSAAPGTPSFHNQSTFFQACTICHAKIHGSNFDPTFFK
jgi:DmsE family decaheme c-type cytochrome